ncbi:MAG: acyl-CoA dehydrogenase family protein [Sulfolobus sp.]|nr:acyl-CoA dehydrogenase family protein [Sulfolobus sp.]
MFSKTSEEGLLVKTVKEFATREIEPLAEKIDREDWYPRDLVRKLGEQGYLIPLHQGLNMYQLSLIIKEIAKASGSVALIQDAQGELAGEAVRAFGTEEQKKKYLEPMSLGEMIGGFGLSEPCCGSDAAALQTTAIKKGGEWVINGKKMWTTQGLYADLYIVFARTGRPEDREKGISAFIVPRNSCIETSKIEVMGFRGTGTAEVTFNDCRVNEENLLGEINGGWRIVKHILNVGRIAISALAIGLAERAMEEAIEWAKSRTAFNSPLIKFQGLRWYIAESSAYLLSMMSVLKEVALKFPDVSDAHISSAKYMIAKEANKIADIAVQIMGGMGYAKGTRVERIYRDIRLTRIGEGTDEVQLMIISKFVEKEGLSELLKIV